jgi:hypothetical protein
MTMFESPIYPNHRFKFKVDTEELSRFEEKYKHQNSRKSLGGDGEKKGKRKRGDDDGQDQEDSNIYQDGRHAGLFSTADKLHLFQHGLEVLPRASMPLRIVQDYPQTIALYSNPTLSEKTRRLLTKDVIAFEGDRSSGVSIDIVPPEEAFDDFQWRNYGRRIRHNGIASALLQIGMLRKDYALATRAFSLILRNAQAQPRAAWTIGLELLTWRRELREKASMRDYHPDKDSLPTNNDLHTRPFKYGSSRREDEEFLEWLVLSFPFMRHIRPQMWKVLPRAPEFYQHLILYKLRYSDPKGALERLQDVMLVPPYNDDPVLYALSGVATMQLMVLEQKKTSGEPSEKVQELCQKSRDYFDRCIELGGVLPDDILKMEMESLLGDGDESKDSNGEQNSNGEQESDNDQESNEDEQDGQGQQSGESEQSGEDEHDGNDASSREEDD